MEGFLRDVFRWSTSSESQLSVPAWPRPGQAFRGNGFDEIVFGPAAVLLLAVAAGRCLAP